MHSIPGELRTDRQPPLAIPLRHFVVALVFLLAGAVMGTVLAGRSLPGLGTVAHRHVLLVGWICLTIMGAMTQFVPVWSGVAIHSRRLAVAQLWLVAGGLAGFVAVLLSGRLELLPAFATLLLVGLWTFVYNVGRTLARGRPLDVTERHFAFALACFAVLAPFGLALAVDFSTPVFDGLPVARTGIVAAHVTLAVFGAVLTTVVGALYQLGRMFTQAELTAVGRSAQALEELLLPAGVVVLAVGRGVDSSLVARIGALAVLLGAFAFVVVVGGLLVRSSVDPSPMTDRYWIVVASLATWALLTVPAWWADPTSPAALLGAPGSSTVLFLGVFGFVVVGTLYHVVPFVVWLERYSDRIGLERVPSVDDLYSTRLERADLAATLAGAFGLAAGGLVPIPTAVVVASAGLVTVGFALFAVNLVTTIHRHGPGGLGGLLLGRLWGSADGDSSGAVDDLERSEG